VEFHEIVSGLLLLDCTLEPRVPLLPLADLDIKGKSLQLSSTSM